MKRSVNLTLKRDLLEELDARRGLASRSAVVQALLERVFTEADRAFAPRLLRDSRVEHAATRNPETGHVFVNPSRFYPTKEAAQAMGDSGEPITVHHSPPTDDLGVAASVREGLHSFNPLHCAGCGLVARDYHG